MKHISFNCRGNTLVSVLIAAAISTIIALSTASMITMQNKQIKTLQQKSEVIDLKNEIVMNLQNANVCACNLNPTLSPATSSLSVPTINDAITSGKQTIDLKHIGLRTNCLATSQVFLGANIPTMTGLKPDSIKVTNLVPTDALKLKWNGKISVSWQDTTELLNLKKIELPIQLELDAATPANARRVSSCSVSGAAGSSGGSGGTLVSNNLYVVTSPSMCDSNASKLCCKEGDFALSASWTGKTGDKAPYYPRKSPECMGFREGNDENPSMCASAEVVCVKN